MYAKPKLDKVSCDDDVIIHSKIKPKHMPSIKTPWQNNMYCNNWNENTHKIKYSIKTHLSDKQKQAYAIMREKMNQYAFDKMIGIDTACIESAKSLKSKKYQKSKSSKKQKIKRSKILNQVFECVYDELY